MAALEQDILATRQLQLVGERLAAEWVHCQWDVDKLDRTTMYRTPVVLTESEMYSLGSRRLAS